MADIKEKRRRITNLILSTIEILADNKRDNNYERLELFLNGLNDEDFEKWAKSCNDPNNPDMLDQTIQLFYDQFNIPKLENIKEALDNINVPMEEYVYYRDINKDGLRTAVPVPVGYLNVKRQQQMLSKKNKYTVDSDDVDPKTGQVRGDSKVAAISDVEATGLISVGANRIVEELFGPRGSNQAQKQEMYRSIAKNGYVSLEDTKLKDDDLSKHTALNTLNMYLLASGIRSDLIVNSLKTAYTIKQEYNNSKN